MTDLMIDHIVSDPEHRRGKPRIKGTGITVQNIVEDIASGLSPEQITERFDLSLGQIYAGLSYYYDHKIEIDQAIESDKHQMEAILASNEYKASQKHTEEIKDRLKNRHSD